MWVWKASVGSDKEKFGLPADYLIADYQLRLAEALATGTEWP